METSNPEVPADGDARLQALLDCSEHFFYYIDFQTRRYEYVSSGVARLFGIDREEFKVHGFDVLAGAVHPDDWARWGRAVREQCALHPGQPVRTTTEYRLRNSRGQERHFHDSSTFCSDADGRLLFAYGIASDVTERRQAEQALRESETRFQTLLSDLEEIVWCYSIDEERMLYLNDAVEAIYGRPKEDFLIHPNLWGDMIHPEDRDFAFAKTRRSLAKGRGDIEARIVTADGRERWLHFRISIPERESGRDRRVVGVASDITERKNAELALRESEHKFRAIMDSARVGIFLMQDGLNRYINPHAAKMFGYSTEEMEQISAYDVTMPEYYAVVTEQLALGARGIAGQPYESMGRRKDGSSFPVQITSTLTTFRGRPASIGTVIDLTEQKAAEARILELAQYDPLTGLPNRRLLEDRVHQALAEAEREEGIVAMFFIDLDHFKRVNDSLGHSAGDQLLKGFTDRLHTVVRRIDTVARLGGDEFVLLMPHLGPGDVAEVARRVIALCVDPFVLDNHRLTVTPSIGISLYPDDGRDFGTLLKNADTAMYRAKEQGRNNFHFYDTEMNIATLERLLLESNLRQALQRGEFTLYYQPLINLAEGRIVGAEALLRWFHPDLGMVPPARFIPVAEDTGLINSIGDWVLREACQQARDWRSSGLDPITMAVNVSPVQFRQRDFLGVVAEALALSELDAEWLELELTEGTVMHDAEANLATMAALQEMKIELAVDDFGTGYSSLAYLKRFPVGKLKIDQSFIRDIVEDANDLAIASTIISMGHSLRLQVLAEGVENGDQLARMLEHGCDLAQGYHFSPPVPAAEFADLLRRQPYLKKCEQDGKPDHQGPRHELPELRAQLDRSADLAARRTVG